MSKSDDWPKLPIRPEDLPLIRELLGAEEYADLLMRLEASAVRAGSPRNRVPNGRSKDP